MDDATIHIPDHSVLPPAGAIMPYAGSAAPSGWLLADGSEVSRTTYSDLFDVCGSTYGDGDGSTTFNLPNLKGKIPVGLDAAQTEFDTRGETGGEKTHLLTTAELPSHSHTINHGHSASSGTESADHSHSGSTGGQSATHTHGMGLGDSATIASGTSTRTHLGSKSTGAASNDHSHSFTTGGRSAAHTHAITVNDHNGSSGSAGSGSAHNNLQPYIVLNYIIKT